jgi:sugar phosphate permease
MAVMCARVVPRPGRSRALVGFAAFGAFWGTWGASLPRVQVEAGVSDAQLGTALLWVGAGALLSIRYVGGLTDRAERSVLPVAVAVLGAVGAMPVFVHGVAALSVVLLLLGVCSGGVDAAINAAAVRAETNGPPVLNLAHAVFSLAVVASSLGVAAASPDGHGRAWALVAVGAILIAAAAVSTILSVADAAPRKDPWTEPDGLPITWSGPLLVLGALAAVAYVVENAWQSWGAIQLHSTVGTSLRLAALAPAVFALAAAAGRLSAHRFAGDLAPAALFGGAAALAAVGSVIAALGGSPGWVIAGIALAGLGTSVCAPTLIALAGQPRFGRQGAATATVITLAYLGFVLGPAAVGLLAGAFTLPTALLAVAALAFGLCAASPLLRRYAEAPV